MSGSHYWPEAHRSQTKWLISFQLCSVLRLLLFFYLSIFCSPSGPHSFLTNSLHRIPQIPDSCSSSVTLCSSTGDKCAAMLLCVEPICKKPDGGLWTDAFALRVVERNVRASLDRWRNVIIPQPHPGEVLGAAERKRNALKDIKNLNK